MHGHNVHVSIIDMKSMFKKKCCQMLNCPKTIITPCLPDKTHNAHVHITQDTKHERLVWEKYCTIYTAKTHDYNKQTIIIIIIMSLLLC